MNPNHIGHLIENQVKGRYGLVDSNLGFDAFACGIHYEIKGCIPIHKNGISIYGKDRITKGRFWIDNRAHRLLLDVDGIYIFLLYIKKEDKILTLRTRFMSSKKVQKWISESDNTKIRYDIIFNEYEPEMIQ